MSMRYFRFIGIAFCLLVSCEKDDDASSGSNFYDGANTSASANALKGIWSIHKVSFESNTADVPSNHQNCGRDFFSFSDNGQYSEYILESSLCDYDVNNLNWELKNGVINFRDDYNQFDEWVITNLSENDLTFKARIDVDEDGKMDIITLYAKRYEPPVVDLITHTFNQNYDEDYQNLISYTWQPYLGVQEFVSYEIYRSTGENCTKENAVLIKTITDAQITEFTDLSPLVEEYLCYYLKTTINTGTLGESMLLRFNTYNLQAIPVNLSPPEVINNTISLKWEKSTMPYFSHYEISYSNYRSNAIGPGQQDVVIANITDISKTAFVDENLPYLENPIYNLFVYDIFGHKSFATSTSYKEVDYRRAELLDIYKLFSYAIAPDEPIVYFYGWETEGSKGVKIHRYNYETNETEAISSLSPFMSTDLSLEIITSNHGKELLLEQGGKLEVYNANTLAHKYDLEASNALRFDDFIYISSGFWVFTDRKFIYTYTRNEFNLTLVDKRPHFTGHQPMYNYSVFEIENNQLILGHRYERNSMVYTVDANGMLTITQTVAVPIMEYDIHKTQFNPTGKYIINFDENRLYSTVNFSLLQSFQHPNFPSGISKDGTRIFGTNNDPKWIINEDSPHAKEVVIFNRTTQQLNKINTKGYPHVVFESYNGKIMSISTGMIRDDLRRNHEGKVDLFIETVDVP